MNSFMTLRIIVTCKGFYYIAYIYRVSLIWDLFLNLTISLLNPWEFLIIHPQFCSPSGPVKLHLLPAQSSHQKKIKQSNQNKTGKQKTTKQNKKTSLLLHFSHLSNTSFVLVVFGALVFQSIPFCPISFTCKYSLQWVIDFVQGLWVLVYHHHWIFTKTPLGYPTVIPSHGDPEVLLHRTSPFMSSSRS